MSFFRIIVIMVTLLVGNAALSFGEANTLFIPDDLPGSRPGADTLTHWRYKEATGQEACNALAAEIVSAAGPDWKNTSSSEDVYTLRTAALQEGVVTDLVVTRIGIRHIELTNRFLINGKEFHICGSNRHQECPYLGNATPSNAARRDARKIKDGGFNFVRLSHYPQDPAFLDACDELGILVQALIPGWQMFRYNSSFIRGTYQDIRDLIRRDRNHPSIVFWEPNLNETDYGQTDWLRGAYEIVHAEYPGDQCLTFGDPYPQNWSGWDVKGMYREYGDFGFGGNESTSQIDRSKPASGRGGYRHRAIASQCKSRGYQSDRLRPGLPPVTATITSKPL